MGVEALIQSMLDRLSPAEREAREAANRRGEALFSYEEMQTADAAIRKAEINKHIAMLAENERMGQLKKHQAEQRMREAAAERRRIENGYDY